MSKVTLQNIENLQNEPSALGRMNSNFQILQAAIDTLLSRDGTVPNQMVSLLDMNNHRIINLPYPVSDQEPARHGDIQQYVDQAEEFRDETEGFRDETLVFRNETEGFRDETEDLLHSFENQYLGPHASDPTVDENGNVPVEGSIYFNTTNHTWRVFVHLSVMVSTDFVYQGAELVEIHYWEELPVTTLRSLADVAADSITNGQFLVWNAGTQDFIPLTLTAEEVPYEGGVDLSSNNVQDAIEELVARTSLAVYDISFWSSGLMENGEKLFRIVASRAFTLPVAAPSSIAKASDAANAETVLTMSKNGVPFGTITFAASGSTGTFTVAGTTEFNVGDVLDIDAPNPADTSLRNTAITLACRR